MSSRPREYMGTEVFNTKKFCPDYAICLFECGGKKQCVTETVIDGQIELEFAECIEEKVGRNETM